jgi:dipeptidyl aminopeptidase/acylaminoacyl peptidase
LRGHGSSEGEASGAYYSGDYIIDTLNAVSALQAADFVNKDKIGLWGHSMAGNVVLRTIAAQPDIQAAVIWGGAVYTYQDLQEYGIDDNSYRPPTQTSERNRRREELFVAHGQFTPDSDFWKAVAPTNYLTDIQTPIQLHHAVNDEVVSISTLRKNLQH